MSTAIVSRVGETTHHHDGSAAAASLREIDREHRVELEDLKRRRVRLYGAGRILVAAVFVIGAFTKWAHFGPTVAAMDAIGIFDGGMLLPFAIFFELVCGLFLAVGFQTRVTAAVLAAYVGFVTLLIHH